MEPHLPLETPLSPALIDCPSNVLPEGLDQLPTVKTIDPHSIIIAPQNPKQSKTDFWRVMGFKLIPIDPATNITTVDTKAWLENLTPACLDAHLAEHTGEGVGGMLPSGVIAFVTQTEPAKQALGIVLKTMTVPPALSTIAGCHQAQFFRLESKASLAKLRAAVPAGVTLLTETDVVPLPTGTDFVPDRYRVASLADLSILTPTDIARLTPANPPAVNRNNPLVRYSLRESIAELERIAVEATPLLGNICLKGQATAIFAPPNSGKTLIILRLLSEAIAAGRIAGANVFYVNADDDGAGLATKGQILADHGAHMLAPGFKGFKTSQLIALLSEMVERDAAKGCLVIIDTVKKVVSLMRKEEVSAFTNVCRDFVMRGGSIVGLAHTNKSRNDGKLQYAGTSDLVDDFDAAYLVDLLSVDADRGEKIVEFAALKRRGCNVQMVCYAYPLETESYGQLLASVREIGANELEGFRRNEETRNDAEVIDIISACLTEDIVKKMELGAAVAKRASISERQAIRVLERYTGTDPLEHRWTYAVEARGAKVYKLLTPPADPSAD